MSFQQLVGGECGGNNSLVQFSNILARDNSMNAQPSSSQADQFVNQYISQNLPAPPQTFQMNMLLQSLKELQDDRGQIGNAAQGNQWMREFSEATKQQQQQSAMGPAAWNMAAPPPMYQMQHMMMPNHANMNSNYMGNRPVVPLQYLDENVDTSNLMMENHTSVLPNELQEKARGLVDAVVDQNMEYNQFVSFMKKIGDGEMTLNVPEDTMAQSNAESSGILNPELEKFIESNKDEWSKLNSGTGHPWLSSVNLNSNPYPAYVFAQENNMLENLNALEIGKEKLKLGDVPGAVLCFEASVKQNATLVEAWLLLGTTQAENEQDPQAIPALIKCIELDPTCLSAYMALGVSYTNENYPHLAYKAFNDWLKANRQYSDLVPVDVDISSMNNFQLQDHIQSLYIRAAQMNPTKVDADIQCALGVLFNISQEYDKAVDCFRAALMVRADDSRLWNKLGATLANGERSEEAVDAYFHALNLEPGFIRARYNIGITCMNLSAYKEAAEHFLTALNQQAKAQGMTPNVSQEHVSSSTIWSTFRMVCAFMGKHELTALIDSRDLNQLNKYFEIE
ncbi:peroxisomal biogenesis factor 5 [Arctopsyche grandis]|uniref:peroxisomal biogenesis factor 5 n=1 Tax=Arctopsyche grandis TaxID=121162 RepID=UPI00406D79C7